MNEQLAALMKEARNKKGLTQKQVANQLDLKNTAITSWESAKSTPNVEQFIKYCQICGADFAEMLTKVYGDPREVQDFKCTPDEAEMIRRYRLIDPRGQRTVSRVLGDEYQDALASFGEDLGNVTGHG